MPKCPHCGKFLTHISLTGANVNASTGASFKGVIYSCPYCSNAITATIDPIALRTEIVAQVVEALGGRR